MSALGSDALVLIFFLTGTVLILNVCAAGLVVMAHLWKREWSHRRRMMAGALLAGALPMFAASGAVMGEIGSASVGQVVGIAIGLGVIVLIFGLFALPLAIVVSRKLGDNRPVGDTFT